MSLTDAPIDDASTQRMDGESSKPKTADPYADTKVISDRISKVLEVDRPARILFSLDWFRNILFLCGAQWIKKENNRWRQRDLPGWFPRAMTNKFAEKYNDLVTQLVNGRKVPISFQPATDDPEDEATAEIGDRLREVIDAEAGVEDKEQEIAGWVIATGNCFVIPHYDMDESHGMTFVQFQTCPGCGAMLKPEDLAGGDEGEPTCPDCGGPLTPSVDPDGNPLGDQYPVGAIQGDVVSPFEMRLDHRVHNFRDLKRYVRIRRYDVDWAKQHWKDHADSIAPDSGGDDLDQYYMDLLANITDSYGSGSPYMGAGQTSKQPKVTAYEFYELPTEEFPEGCRAVRLGKNPEAVVEAGPLKTKYGAGVKKGQFFLPGTHFGFDRVPGRLWFKTRLDDLVPLQLFRNVVDAIIRLTCQRMANPVWLNPKGCGVDIITGEPGQKIDYNPMSVGGTSVAKPERIPAELSNLQPLVLMLKIIDDAMERVAGTFFLQGGTAPPGVTAASALAYLGEKSQQAMSTLSASWAKGWREFYKQALEIARENWDESRLRIIAGKNKKWDVEKFTKADIQGAVNLVIDYAGLGPKSVATERATIGQLVQLGVLNPQDEETAMHILRKFGELDITGSQSLDVKYWQKILDRFMTDPTFLPSVRPFIDDSKVGLMLSTDLAKTDEFGELPPERQQAFVEFIKTLVLDITTRRMMLTQAGLDPDTPALAEVPSGDAAVAAQAAAQAQGGGVPSGAEGPDPRLDASGAPIPGGNVGAPQTPDIAMMGEGGDGTTSIRPPGSPRPINIPGA